MYFRNLPGSELGKMELKRAVPYVCHHEVAVATEDLLSLPRPRKVARFAPRYLVLTSAMLASLGRFAACHASNPPARSTTLWYPARCSRLHAIRLR